MEQRDRFSRAQAVLSAVNAVASHIAHASLWLLTAVVLWDVLWRSFGAPTIWGAEVSVYLMLALAFLGIGHTWSEDGHFRVTLLVGRFGPRARLSIEFFCTVVALVFVVLFSYGAFKLSLFAYQMNFSTPTVLKLPLVYLYGLVFLGGVSLAVALLEDMIRILRGRSRDAHVTDIWAA
jgi:C4-dicarboxylate transporter DctQ subunit